MDRSINFYKKCVKQLLGEYESLNTDWSTVELIFDDERMRYLVMRIGWSQAKYIHRCLVHIDIVDNKIVIRANNTENMLSEGLVELGVPADKIEIGFLPPIVHEHVQQKNSAKQFAFAY